MSVSISLEVPEVPATVYLIQDNYTVCPEIPASGSGSNTFRQPAP